MPRDAYLSIIALVDGHDAAPQGSHSQQSKKPRKKNQLAQICKQSTDGKDMALHKKSSESCVFHKYSPTKMDVLITIMAVYFNVLD